MKKWVFALIIGIAMLSLGARTDVGSSTITCGSETMSPGDVCEETRGGVTTDTKTYDEMKESQEAGARTFNSWGRWALLGAGGVLTIVGIFGIVVVRRRRAAAAAHPQALQPQTVQPQAAQPRFVPPQQTTNAPNQPYSPSAPYPQQMPQQQYSPQVPSQPSHPRQQQYPPQGWGPTGPSA